MVYNELQRNGSYDVNIDRVYPYQPDEYSEYFYAEALYMGSLGEESQEMFATPIRFQAPPACEEPPTTLVFTTPEPVSTTTSTTPTFLSEWTCDDVGAGFYSSTDPALTYCYEEENVSFIRSTHLAPNGYSNAGYEISCYTRPSFSCESIGLSTNSGVGDISSTLNAPSCYENAGDPFTCYTTGEDATCEALDSGSFADQNFFGTRSASSLTIPAPYSNQGEQITCYNDRDAVCADFGYYNSQNIFDTLIEKSVDVPAYGYLNDEAQITCYESINATCADLGYFDQQNIDGTRIEQSVEVPLNGYANEGVQITCYEDP